MVTYFVLVGFQLGKNGVLIADEPQEVHGGNARCLAAAKRLAESRAGVLAFSRTGDPKMGDWNDAVILWKSGVVPEEAYEMAG